VQNLSGYMNLSKDVVVFSFLINDSEKNFLRLQKAQDRALAGIYQFLLAQEPPPPPRPAGRKQPGARRRGAWRYLK
jgi:hypothetical protein